MSNNNEFDSFEELMRDASRTYHAPPEPPLDDMWRSIEREHFGASAPRTTIFTRSSVATAAGIAAALVIGVGVGRYVVPARAVVAAAPIAGRTVAQQQQADDTIGVFVDGAYEAATNRYLGQTIALLASLPREAGAGDANTRLVSQATELLTTTRLLLDSPAAKDPQMRSLLDDLELVLAQIARLPARQQTSELDLITETLKQRDVVPRLRTAVADIASSNN